MSNKRRIDLSVTTSRSVYTKSDGVEHYINIARRYAFLSKEEEYELFQKMRKGDESAKDKIAGSFQLFVYAIAKRYVTKGIDIMDLVEEGNVGLLESMEKFNPDSGNRFISYAVWMITRRIMNFCKNNNVVKRGSGDRYSYKTNKIRNRFLCLNGREATNEELTDILKEEYGVEIADPDCLDEIVTLYLENKISDSEDERDLLSTPEVSEKTCSYNGYEDVAEREDAKILVEKYLSSLDARSEYILRHYYGIGCEEECVDVIAENMGVCNERVRQLWRGALKEIGRRYKEDLNSVY